MSGEDMRYRLPDVGGAVPFSREFHERCIDHHVDQLARALEAWNNRDREDPSRHSSVAGHLRLHANGVASNVAALAALSYAEYVRSVPR